MFEPIVSARLGLVVGGVEDGLVVNPKSLKLASLASVDVVLVLASSVSGIVDSDSTVVVVVVAELAR